LKFLDFFIPEHINKLCREFTVKVQITAYQRANEDIIHRIPVERPPGSGNIAIEEVTEKWEQIELQNAREIRSWNDLFQNDSKYPIFLSSKEMSN
jgi:CRISPR/Cas system-associated protein endoribonuclease Cas2